MRKLLLFTILLYGVTTSAQCWESISNGETHVMAIKPNGTLWGWGRGDVGLNGNSGISANEPQHHLLWFFLLHLKNNNAKQNLRIYTLK
jgi:hypothetical protein